MRECEQTENILEEVKEDDMLSVLLGKKDLFDWHLQWKDGPTIPFF